MWKKLLESFDPQQTEDPHFGPVELQANDQDHTFYLMKDVWMGDQEETISLTIESAKKESSQSQFELFTLITNNFPQIADTAFDYMKAQLGDKSVPELKKVYQFESIYIGDNKDTPGKWELTLLNIEDGNTYCVIDFDKLTALDLSIEE